MAFRFYCPVRVVFGQGKLSEIGAIAREYGKRILLVTEPRKNSVQGDVYLRAEKSLEKAGVKIFRFDGVTPNPTTETMAQAEEVARKNHCDVVAGIGGGSTMDVAKGAAVAATHPGGVWRYIFCSKHQPTAKTLPIILATTTSGTGSHTSKCSVVTNPRTHEKLGVVSDHIFAKVSIVDPDLLVSMPPQVTASTGFDVITHAFERSINKNANPIIDQMALQSISLVAQYLPKAMKDPKNIEVRSMMAIADTLAGMCIANVGTTLPHSMAQAVSGHFPHVPHGTALAAVYPPIFGYSWSSSVAKFAAVARLLDRSLAKASDREAAKKSRNAVEKFLRSIGLFKQFKDINVDAELVPVLSKDAKFFPDTEVHPRIADEKRIQALYKELA